MLPSLRGLSPGRPRTSTMRVRPTGDQDRVQQDFNIASVDQRQGFVEVVMENTTFGTDEKRLERNIPV